MLRSLLLVCALTACASSSSEPDWKFGAAEAESSLAGKWTGTFTSGGKTGSIDLELALAAPTAAPKCGNRTLSTDLAPKCMDTTSVRLVGKLTTSDGAFNAAAMTGGLEVFTTTLTSGWLELKTADGKSLTAQYSPSTFKDGRLALASGEAVFTLTRR